VAGGVLGHVDVDDPSAMMGEHDENEEHAQARGGDREEVERDEVADMVGEERPRLPPPGPDSGQAGPEQAVSRVELRAGQRSLVDGELPAQGQVLQAELAVAADEEGEEPEQVDPEGDHRAAIAAGEDRQMNHLAGG
jgi:hypothetical protein